jgi:hypothetical protein
MRNINIIVSECSDYWSVDLEYEYGTPLTAPNHYSAHIKSNGPTALDAIMNLCKVLKKQKKQMSPYLAEALFKPLEKL